MTDGQPPDAGWKKSGLRVDKSDSKRKRRNSATFRQLLKNRQMLLIALQVATAIVKLVRAIWSLIHIS